MGGHLNWLKFLWDDQTKGWITTGYLGSAICGVSPPKSGASPTSRIRSVAQTGKMTNFFNGATAIFSKKVDPEILLDWRTFPFPALLFRYPSDKRLLWRKAILRSEPRQECCSRLLLYQKITYKLLSSVCSHQLEISNSQWRSGGVEHRLDSWFIRRTSTPAMSILYRNWCPTLSVNLE